MQAKDIMTTAVITVDQGATIEEAVDLMLTHHISGLPVVDADAHLVGLISEGDLMRRLRDNDAPRRSWWLELFALSGGTADDFVKTRSHHVSDVMTRKLVTVTETTPVGEIARTLEKNRIKRVPVVRDDTCVGIVSRGNLLQALSRVDTNALPTPKLSDEELRRAVQAALEQVPGASVNLVNFTVEDGRVSLSGFADSDFVESGLRVAAENVPGVRAVETSMRRLPAWGYGL